MLPLILGGVTALAGFNNAKRKNEQMEKANKAASEQTRYSAWSGLGQGQINNNYADPLTSAIGSGLQGAAFGQGLGSLGGGGSPTPAPTQDPMMASYEGANSLGGQDMASQFGQMGQQGSAMSPWDFQDQPLTGRTFAYNK